MGIAWFKSLAAIGFPKFESPHGGDRSFVCPVPGRRIRILLSYFATVRRGEDLSVLHFNHKLRGRESDEDQQFVESICSSLKVPLITDFWEREDIDASVSEDDARAARIAFFSGYLSDQERDTAILTGHHAGDVLETMLMRISRGSGLQGLTAPREVSRGPDGLLFFRPLLRLRKDRIVDYLRQAGAEWREDASNQTDALLSEPTAM